MLAELSVRSFLGQLAAGSASPGGGATAALHGAQGAALIAMVCNLTIGRKRYKHLEPQMLASHQQVQILLAQLTDLIDRDASAYDGVMVAYRLPKQTAEEQQRRSEAVQVGLKNATRVPLETMDACLKVLTVGESVLELGNPNVISDGAAGILTAHTGMLTAALNVQINLNAIQDEEFVQESKAHMATLTAAGDSARLRSWALVEERLGM